MSGTADRSTLREHPDRDDNVIADACEHCGRFSCSGECQDDGPVLGSCPHGVDLDRAFCPHGCRR